MAKMIGRDDPSIDPGVLGRELEEAEEAVQSGLRAAASDDAAAAYS
jgi:hypothetical protein